MKRMIIVCGMLIAQTAAAQEEADRSVFVTVTNADAFPVRVTWFVPETKLFDAEGFIGSSKVPSGKVQITCKPYFEGEWYQWAVWLVNEKLVNSGQHTLLFDVKPGDKIRIIPLSPGPTWTAAQVRIGDTPVLVKINHVSAQDNLKAFEEGKYKGTEKYPNVFFFWATSGSPDMAKDLAATFAAKKDDEGATFGRFQGTMSVTLYTPVDQGKTVKELRDARTEDVEAGIAQALRIIRKQVPVLGTSVETEIQTAKKLLEQGRPKPVDRST